MQYMYVLFRSVTDPNVSGDETNRYFIYFLNFYYELNSGVAGDPSDRPHKKLLIVPTY